MKTKPFIKWVGGKRQIADTIYSKFPESFNNYFEPFVGGGAIYFGYPFKDGTECYINDYNQELYNLYDVVKHHVNELIADLQHHENTKDYFLSLRALDRTPDYNQLSNIQKASRFIYLNRTAFNGLYRVNKSGQFNVPFGNYKNPKILDRETLLLASQKLQSAHISQGDYYQLKDKIQPGDFVYLDPPYDPLTETANFTGYTDQGFNKDAQTLLKSFCDHIDSIGAYFLQSNANTPFIRALYCGYTIDTVSARRSINSQGDKRGEISELLISNY